tara:strand:+ start:35498 stop:35809 length:312 start_codon:yes stop_codon:yes gene_type:complete
MINAEHLNFDDAYPMDQIRSDIETILQHSDVKLTTLMPLVDMHKLNPINADSVDVTLTSGDAHFTLRIEFVYLVDHPNPKIYLFSRISDAATRIAQVKLTIPK